VAELKPGLHGSTFGGNPLACAAAQATLEVLESEQLPRRAALKGDYAFGRLASLTAGRLVREVRGMGLMIGIELTQKSRPYLQALQDRGIMALPAGPTVVRLLPPLNILDEDLNQVLDTVVEVLSREIPKSQTTGSDE
jgi:LysW-gamma-L-lysine/LysW-L-ornithine aminotransferase